MTPEQRALKAALGYIERNSPHLVRDEIRTLVSERDELASRVRELEGALRVARDNVADWGGYIGAYFQAKHDLEGDLAAIDAALNASIGPTP